jgi:hypothetical protein
MCGITGIVSKNSSIKMNEFGRKIDLIYKYSFWGEEIN